jgi:hypothetical protein
MPSITEISGYMLAPIREGAGFNFYRGPGTATHRRSWQWQSPPRSVLERYQPQPLDLTRMLHIATGLLTALRRGMTPDLSNLSAMWRNNEI